MIFDKDFDRALWLLVSAKKKYSANICKLISLLPENVYEQIQTAIVRYYDNSLGNVRDSVIYSTTLSNVDGFDYYVVIKVISGKLYFNVRRWNEKNSERLEEDYELVLKRFYEDDLFLMLYGEKCNVGKYSHEFSNIKYEGYLPSVDTEIYDMKYRIKRIPFGFIVSNSLGRRTLGRKYVNVAQNMPEDICVTDFSSEENIAGLIKKRKRNKK